MTDNGPLDQEKNKQTQDPAYVGNLSKAFDGIKPEHGFDLIPPEGTEPQPLIVQKFSLAILHKLNAAGAKYQGETNGDGLRHGKGKITYIDGSTYDGEWKNGLRDGLGEQHYKDGSIYRGNWKADQQNGEGKIIKPDGEQVQASWEQGKKNGKGLIISADGKKQHEVEFFSDIQFKADEQNNDCWNFAPVSLGINLLILILFYFTYNSYAYPAEPKT